MPADSQTPAVQRALTDPTLTEEERANLVLVLLFRAAPFSERSKYTVAGFRPSRIGMATLAALNTDPELTYSGQSIPVCPGLDLVVVRLGDTPTERGGELTRWKADMVAAFA